MDEIDLTKRFTILGLGISGISTLNFLIDKKTEKIFLSDKRPFNSLAEPVRRSILSNRKFIETEFGCEHSFRFLDTDYLVVSPGINYDSNMIQEAKRRSLEVITEAELAARLTVEQGKSFIGVTGTNGKSTVTSWISHIMNFPACGNIGKPFIEAIESSPSDAYVCELSSFQLAHSGLMKPKIAIITNITPDHISWHGSWEHYVKSKFRITQGQSQEDWLILPRNNLFQNISTKAKVIWVEAKPQSQILINNVVWVNQQLEIIFRKDGVDEKICDVSDIPLPGTHNLENAMFSIVAAKLYGQKTQDIVSKLTSFKGLEHRLEFVTEKKGKRFFNDSKATNPESSAIALSAFPGNIVWLVGGRDKNTDLTELCQQASRTAITTILFGEASKRFTEALRNNLYTGEIVQAKNLNEAVDLSVTKDGDVVLLSPACSSFDQFENFEQRGKFFKEKVLSLS